MSYHLKLEVFEGPMDLLLHLIQNAEIDIYEIPISEVTSQYIDYLFQLEQLDLEIASSFLVMAATLISIKIKMLLPKPVQTDADELDEEDPRAELVRQLLAYKMFKNAAGLLEQLHASQAGIALCHSMYFGMRDKKADCGLGDFTLDDLTQAYRNAVIGYLQSDSTVEIEKEVIPIRKKIEDILRTIFSSNQGIRFQMLIKNPHSKHEQIVTFLAILELARSKHIKVHQDSNFYEITVFRRGKEGV